VRISNRNGAWRVAWRRRSEPGRRSDTMRCGGLFAPGCTATIKLILRTPVLHRTLLWRAVLLLAVLVVFAGRAGGWAKRRCHACVVNSIRLGVFAVTAAVAFGVAAAGAARRRAHSAVAGLSERQVTAGRRHRRTAPVQCGGLSPFFGSPPCRFEPALPRCVHCPHCVPFLGLWRRHILYSDICFMLF
jgi:hypothetical protein